MLAAFAVILAAVYYLYLRPKGANFDANAAGQNARSGHRIRVDTDAVSKREWRLRRGRVETGTGKATRFRPSRYKAKGRSFWTGPCFAS